MSTRAVYFFVQDGERFAVYKHSDGYPSGAAQAIDAARKAAWEGDCFEADEAAASFVAANKKNPGDVRLMSSQTWKGCACDVAYAYEIKPGWKVTAYEMGMDGHREKIWTGPLSDMPAWSASYEA